MTDLEMLEAIEKISKLFWEILPYYSVGALKTKLFVIEEEGKGDWPGKKYTLYKLNDLISALEQKRERSNIESIAEQLLITSVQYLDLELKTKLETININFKLKQDIHSKENLENIKNNLINLKSFFIELFEKIIINHCQSIPELKSIIDSIESSELKKIIIDIANEFLDFNQTDHTCGYDLEGHKLFIKDIYKITIEAIEDEKNILKGDIFLEDLDITKADLAIEIYLDFLYNIFKKASNNIIKNPKNLSLNNIIHYFIERFNKYSSNKNSFEENFYKRKSYDYDDPHYQELIENMARDATTTLKQLLNGSTIICKKISCIWQAMQNLQEQSFDKLLNDLIEYSLNLTELLFAENNYAYEDCYEIEKIKLIVCICELSEVELKYFILMSNSFKFNKSEKRYITYITYHFVSYKLFSAHLNCILKEYDKLNISLKEFLNLSFSEIFSLLKDLTAFTSDIDSTKTSEKYIRIFQEKLKTIIFNKHKKEILKDQKGFHFDMAYLEHSTLYINYLKDQAFDTIYLRLNIKEKVKLKDEVVYMPDDVEELIKIYSSLLENPENFPKKTFEEDLIQTIEENFKLILKQKMDELIQDSYPEILALQPSKALQKSHSLDQLIIKRNKLQDFEQEVLKLKKLIPFLGKHLMERIGAYLHPYYQSLCFYLAQQIFNSLELPKEAFTDSVPTLSNYKTLTECYIQLAQEAITSQSASTEPSSKTLKESEQEEQKLTKLSQDLTKRLGMIKSLNTLNPTLSTQITSLMQEAKTAVLSKLVKKHLKLISVDSPPESLSEFASKLQQVRQAMVELKNYGPTHLLIQPALEKLQEYQQQVLKQQSELQETEFLKQVKDWTRESSDLETCALSLQTLLQQSKELKLSPESPTVQSMTEKLGELQALQQFSKTLPPLNKLEFKSQPIGQAVSALIKTAQTLKELLDTFEHQKTARAQASHPEFEPRALTQAIEGFQQHLQKQLSSLQEVSGILEDPRYTPSLRICEQWLSSLRPLLETSSSVSLLPALKSWLKAIYTAFEVRARSLQQEKPQRPEAASQERVEPVSNLSVNAPETLDKAAIQKNNERHSLSRFLSALYTHSDELKPHLPSLISGLAYTCSYEVTALLESALGPYSERSDQLKAFMNPELKASFELKALEKEQTLLLLRALQHAAQANPERNSEERFCTVRKHLSHTLRTTLDPKDKELKKLVQHFQTLVQGQPSTLDPSTRTHLNTLASLYRITEQLIEFETRVDCLKGVEPLFKEKLSACLDLILHAWTQGLSLLTQLPPKVREHLRHLSEEEQRILQQSNPSNPFIADPLTLTAAQLHGVLALLPHFTLPPAEPEDYLKWLNQFIELTKSFSDLASWSNGLLNYTKTLAGFLHLPQSIAPAQLLAKIPPKQPVEEQKVAPTDPQCDLKQSSRAPSPQKKAEPSAEDFDDALAQVRQLAETYDMEHPPQQSQPEVQLLEGSQSTEPRSGAKSQELPKHSKPKGGYQSQHYSYGKFPYNQKSYSQKETYKKETDEEGDNELSKGPYYNRNAYFNKNMQYSKEVPYQPRQKYSSKLPNQGQNRNQNRNQNQGQETEVAVYTVKKKPTGNQPKP